MSDVMKLEGFKELDDALEDLTKAAGKGALRRAAKSALEPMAELARRFAPRGKGDLVGDITVGTKLSKRQASIHRKMFRDDRAAVEMHMGPGPDPAGVNQEFGNINHAAQPFMRPAWDQDRHAMLDRLKVDLKQEIDKALARAARKAARQARS